MTGYHVIKLNGDAATRLSWKVHVPEPYSARAHVELMESVRLMPEWKQIVLDNFYFISKTCGPDLMIQSKPYLRIARTGMARDNIGIHRDTDYGATDREWVLWIPLTDATNGAELLILPDSHLKPVGFYRTHIDMEFAVAKGSDENKLGFLHTPKKLEKCIEDECIRVPCKVGSAILFNAACVHGQIINTAPWTRVSIDIRLTDVSVPQRLTVHGELYERLAA